MRYLFKSLFLVFLIVFAGCTGPEDFIADYEAIYNSLPDPDPTANDNITYTGKIYSIGDPAGDLKEELSAALTLQPYDGASTDGPIMIPGDVIELLSSQNIDGIKAAYTAGQPILLVQATADQINQFVALLSEEEYSFFMPEGMTSVEIFGVDLEPDGSMFQWVQYPPSGTDAVPDDSEDQQDRVGILVDWLKDNSTRMASAEAQAAKRQAMKDEVADLTQLTSAFVNQSNFTHMGNNYQITHYVYSCHSIATNDDWFFIQQQCIFNGSGAYKGILVWRRGSVGDVAEEYMDRIEINSTMNGYKNQSSLVGLMQSSPETANNVTQVTSGVTWNIGGEVSYGKADGPAAKLSGGVAVSNSKTVNISDCTALNKSNDEGNNAHWIYQFARCDSIGHFSYAGVTSPPALAVTTFQPLNQWIWRMNNAVRQNKATMHVDLSVGLVGTMGILDFLWKSHPKHVTFVPGHWFFDIKIPYPAVP